MSITLSSITIYPIKSCGGIELTTAEIDERGLRYDRRWMVVNKDGVFMTQRDFPLMTLIAVELLSDALRIHAPNMPPLLVPLMLSNAEHTAVHIRSDTVNAVTVGIEAEVWFSEFLGTPSKLVAMTDASLRRVDTRYARRGESVSFADGFPLLLISQASLDDLNVRLETPVPMRRFRPNLVVDGCAPFAEDKWKVIAIGDVRFRVVKPCARCVITTVDMQTGEAGVEPLRTLATFRTIGNKVMFGQYLLHQGNGTVRVGDEVTILQQ